MAAHTRPAVDAAQLCEFWMAVWLMHADALPDLQVPPLAAPESDPSVGVEHHVQPLLSRHVEQLEPL